MPLISVVSAKGSPGVTTVAAALVAAAHGPDAPRTGGVLVELDPAGGDVELLVGARTGESSLLAAARDVRRGAVGTDLAAHAVEVRPGVRTVLAPVSAPAAGSVIEAVGSQVTAEVAAVTGWVVADAGRWDPGQPSAGRLQRSDVVGVVARSTAVSIAHARDLLAHLRGQRAVVVLVGDEPYGQADVAGVVEVPVLGPMAWDPGGVAELWASGASPRWQARRPLGRSARRVLDELTEIVDRTTTPVPAGRGLAQRTPEASR